jgi:hypothetical protein
MGTTLCYTSKYLIYAIVSRIEKAPYETKSDLITNVTA